MASVQQTASVPAVEYRRVLIIVALAVVALIMWLIASVAFPAYIKGWNLSRCRRILGDVRQMDDAIDRWATETGKQEGDDINTTEAAAYLKGGAWQATDIMGNPYEIGFVGKNQVTVSAATKALI